MDGLKEIIIAIIAMVGTIAGKEYWDYRKNKDTIEGDKTDRVNTSLRKKIEELELKLSNCKDEYDKNLNIKQDRIDHLERENFRISYDLKLIKSFLNIVKDEADREKLMKLFHNDYNSEITSTKT